MKGEKEIERDREKERETDCEGASRLGRLDKTPRGQRSSKTMGAFVGAFPCASVRLPRFFLSQRKDQISPGERVSWERMSTNEHEKETLQTRTRSESFLGSLAGGQKSAQGSARRRMKKEEEIKKRFFF